MGKFAYGMNRPCNYFGGVVAEWSPRGQRLDADGATTAAAEHDKVIRHKGALLSYSLHFCASGGKNEMA